MPIINWTGEILIERAYHVKIEGQYPKVFPALSCIQGGVPPLPMFLQYIYESPSRSSELEASCKTYADPQKFDNDKDSKPLQLAMDLLVAEQKCGELFFCNGENTLSYDWT